MLSRELSGAGSPGGVLADEMGLGKTVQTIAACLGNPQSNPTLIIAPKSLLTQWQREISKFSSMRSFTLHTKYSANEPHLVATKLASLGNKFILATYETVARMPALMGCPFSRIILDESHRIKNRATKTYKAVSILQGQIKWCLTGTPIMRRPSDFKALLAWIGEDVTFLDMQYARETYLLRRTFEDLSKVCARLALPPCHITNHVLELSQSEKDVYNAMVSYGQFCVRTNAALIADGGDRREAVNAILEVLLRLQQIVVSPEIIADSVQAMDGFIFDPRSVETARPPDDDDCPICMQAFSEETACKTECGHWFCRECITSAVLCAAGFTCPMCRAEIVEGSVRVVQSACGNSPALSTKLLKINELVDANRAKKVLVFTHWKREATEIEKMLTWMGVDHVRIDGGMSIEKRQAVVDDFNDAEDGRVLISQIQVGGCGLNIQSASMVILPSLDWSPATEMQAIARAHRLGVAHPVYVHRLVARGSVDDHVLRIQGQKLEYASQLFEDKRVSKKLGFDTSNIHELSKLFALIT